MKVRFIALREFGDVVPPSCIARGDDEEKIRQLAAKYARRNGCAVDVYEVVKHKASVSVIVQIDDNPEE